MIGASYSSIPNAWYYTLGRILLEGEDMTTEYGDTAKYVNGALVEITNPRAEWHSKDPYCSKRRVAEYTKQFRRDFQGGGFEYLYIDRMIKYPVEPVMEMVQIDPYDTSYHPNLKPQSIDQLAWMKQQLLDQRFDSRRIQCITWIPGVDLRKKEDQPCFQRLWVFPKRNYKLDVHISYRSWDWFKAFEANMMGFLEVINTELLSDGPNEEPNLFTLGTLRCFGDNIHVYGKDIDDAKSALS